ncbi:MAG: LysM peptidoglycan-binding domain-containing protein [Nanoarchaeota archaeon]
MFEKTIKYIRKVVLGVGISSALFTGTAFANSKDLINQYYGVVESGQNLSHIAQEISHKYGEKLTYDELGKSSQINNFDKIRPGDKLILPQSFLDKLEKKGYEISRQVENSQNNNDKFDNFDSTQYDSLEKKIIKNNNSDSNQTREEIDVKTQIKSSKNLEKKLDMNQKTFVHEVRKGDSYYKIAKLYGLNFKSLSQSNNNKMLHPGDVLEINYNDAHMRGYIPNNINYNKKLAKSKTGGEFAQDRFHFGVENFAKLIGADLGRAAKGKKRDMNSKKSIPHWIEAGKEYKVSPYIIGAIERHETGGEFTFSHTGSSGKYGHTHQTYNPQVPGSDGIQRKPINPLNDRDSAIRTADYLRNLHWKYGNQTFILTAYNRGEKDMDKLIRGWAKKLNVESGSLRKMSRDVVKKGKQLGISVDKIIKTKKKNGEYFLTKEGAFYAEKVAQEYKSLKTNEELSALIEFKKKQICKNSKCLKLNL